MIRKDATVKRGAAGALAGLIAVGALAAAMSPPPSGGDDKPAKADDKAAAKAPEFKSSKDKASYAIGLNIGRTILRDFGRGDAVDADQFLKGLKAGLAGEQT